MSVFVVYLLTYIVLLFSYERKFEIGWSSRVCYTYQRLPGEVIRVWVRSYRAPVRTRHAQSPRFSGSVIPAVENCGHSYSHSCSISNR